MGGKYDVKFGDNSLIIRLHRLCYKPRYKVGSIVTKVSPSPPTQTPLWPPPLSLLPCQGKGPLNVILFIPCCFCRYLFIDWNIFDWFGCARRRVPLGHQLFWGPLKNRPKNLIRPTSSG